MFLFSSVSMINSSNSNLFIKHILLYQVSDFGLAKIALELDSNTHVSTRVMGTFG